MKHEHPLKKHYMSMRLTSAERTTMHATLRAHMHATHKKPVRSPLGVFFSAATRPVAALLVISFIGTATSGITYASQTALPDETLYSVKQFVERIETALAQTSHGQVRTAGVHALSRIQEATRMYVEGRMTTEHEQNLSQAIREELVRVSRVVATQNTDTVTARESAVVLAKIVGYTNVLNQTIESTGEQSTKVAKMSAPLMQADSTSTSLVGQIEYFVDTHEDAIAEAVSNDANIVAEHFIGEIGTSLLEETPDPLVEATITAVIASERVIDMFPAEKGGRVLHALADMAEGSASVEALNAMQL